jgi:translocation and assembly module TamA
VYKGILILSFVLMGISAKAQQYTFTMNQGAEATHLKVSDSLQAYQLLNRQLTQLRNEGYLAAYADSLLQQNDTLLSTVHKGYRYKAIHINSHNISREYLAQQKHIGLDLASFGRFQQQLITLHENNGFPFAHLKLKDNYARGDTLYTTLFFDPYIKFEYDSIVYNGSATISKTYLAKYLNIEQGKLYDESVVKTIDQKLRNLPLVKMKGASRIVFFRGKVRVVLKIDDNITDRLDGVVGLAPNSANSQENQLLITGELNIELNNLFKSGKQLELHWRNYLQNSQKLDLGFTYPYLFNTRVGISSEFNLNKFDTLFVNLQSKLSLRYQQQGNNYVQVYYQNVNSNLLSADTSAVRVSKKIPTNNPYTIRNYGLAIFQQDLDYLPNPRKGYRILADGAIGQKQIVRNADIRQVKFANSDNGSIISVYDTAQLKSTRLEFKVASSYFIPIKKRSTLHQKLSFQGLFASNVFFNELYNFGGYSSLRGFDENEFFASKMLTYTAEYRYLIGENSYVGLFANTALLENKLESDVLIFDIPYGFGVSANIQVGKGILNLAYALGSRQGNTLQLSAAKFHFGVVNYF